MPTNVTPSGKNNSSSLESEPILPTSATPTPVRMNNGTTYGVTAQADSVTQTDMQGEFAAALLQRQERENGTNPPPPPEQAFPPRRGNGTAFSTAPYTTATVTAAALISTGIEGLVKEGVWSLNPNGSTTTQNTTAPPVSLATLLGKEDGTPVEPANNTTLAEQWIAHGARPKTTQRPRTLHPLSVEARRARTQEAEKGRSRHKRSVDGSSSNPVITTSTSTTPKTSATSTQSTMAATTRTESSSETSSTTTETIASTTAKQTITT